MNILALENTKQIIVLNFQLLSFLTSSVFTLLTILSIISSSSIKSLGGDNLCTFYWFSGSLYIGHRLIGGFGIALFRFISLIHQTTFVRYGAQFFIKVILVYQVMFYAGNVILQYPLL